MIHYIIQIIAFQLLFLVVYDLFLKKETFFNLNRAYLLVTPVLSLVLPFIKIATLKEAVPRDHVLYLPEVIVGNTANINKESWFFSIDAGQWIIIIGILISLLLFLLKIMKIYKLKGKGEITKHQYFTKVIIRHSSVAFSFFRNVFLGDEVLKKDHKHIIEHELVHINQGHSWDLIFFELLRIVFWFNPLVYIYQNRIAELHEFIADKHTIKTNKEEHYQHLLEEVFKTENISFINQFFNHSLIKKRIVMLQKPKTKKVWQLKYLSLVPLLIGMLIYTSCDKDTTTNTIDAVEVTNEPTSVFDNEDISFINIDVKPSFKEPCEVDGMDHFQCFKQKLDLHVRNTFKYPEEAIEKKIEGRVYINFKINTDGTVKVIDSEASHPILEKEGIRIIESLPEFNPGTDAKGNIVPVTFAYPIVFKLK